MKFFFASFFVAFVLWVVVCCKKHIFRERERERKKQQYTHMSSGDASSSSSSCSSLKAVVAISFSVGVITGFVLNSKLRKLL
jgi:hypothetical protein